MSNSTFTLTPDWVSEELHLGLPLWAGFSNLEDSSKDHDWTPATDLYDAGDRLIASIDLPGIDRDTIDITFQDGTLAVKAASAQRAVEGQVLICCERARGSFSRIIELETDVDANKVEATYTDGVLEIVLPKAESAKPHKINIAVK